MAELGSITWNHTRGYVPLATTAQRFSELHPDTTIRWENRPWQQSADAPIEDIAGQVANSVGVSHHSYHCAGPKAKRYLFVGIGAILVALALLGIGRKQAS